MQKETAETKFESYFLPFSAQINERTVISQSGLISQTISVNSETEITFQEDIINAIKEVYTKNVTVNIHAVYSKNDTKKQNNLIDYIKSAYKNNIYPQKDFSQKFFITLSIHGYQVTKQNLINLLFERSFLLELEKSVKKLQEIVEEFTENIHNYNPQILKTTELSGEIYSENSSFLHQIIYGEASQESLKNMEISEQLRPISIKRQKNYLILTHNQQQQQITGQKAKQVEKQLTFVSCFTIKDFPKTDPSKLIKLFTLNNSFIISQTIHSIKREAIKSLFEYQVKITNAIRDNDIASKCGWDEILAEENPISMQTNIVIHATTLEELNAKTKEIAQCFHDIGLVAVMEDLNLEQAFYASMPSNAAFCNRLEYGAINYAGQFLLSKNMIFSGVREMKNFPFMPMATVHQKYYTLSFFEKEKSHNILIHGIQNELFTNTINTILLHTQVNNIISLDSNHSSLGLNKLKGGMYFKNPEVNMMNLLKFDRKNFEIFFTSFTLYFCIEHKIPRNDIILEEIRKFVAKLKAEHTFEQIQEIAQRSTVAHILTQVLTFAKENHFLSEKDVLMHKNKFISINTSGVHPMLCGMFALYILLFNIHKVQAYDAIKLDRTFDVFDPKIIPQQVLVQILQAYKLKRASIICCINLPIAFEQKQISRYSDLFINFDIKIFTEGSCSNYFVKTFFQLNSEMTKHLMFVKSGTKRAVVQTLSHSYTINLQPFTCNELAILNTKHKNFVNLIKLIENNKTPSQSVIEAYNELI